MVITSDKCVIVRPTCRLLDNQTSDSTKWIIWLTSFCHSKQFVVVTRNWRHCWFMVAKSLSDVKYNPIAFSVQLHQYNYTLITIVECYVILYCYWLMLIFCQYGWMGTLKEYAPFDFSKLMNNTRVYFYVSILVSNSPFRNESNDKEFW